MGNGTMETARSHSVTTQRVGPDEAESPGGADSAQQSCGRRPRGDGRVTALSSCLLPDPCGFSGVAAVSCGETPHLVPRR